jgi:putative toxin-antitoxin system antitoxin component (TIGR02293 family)
MKKSLPKPKAIVTRKGSLIAPKLGRKLLDKEFEKLDGKVVQSCIHGPSGKTSVSPPTALMLIESLKAGLPLAELTSLRASLDLPMDRLAPMLGISKATLHRRKTAGRLDPAESDRVVRFARLMGKAVYVFETEQNARSWLTSPQYGLGGAVPLDYAGTEVGAREVEDLLGRIAHGVYS